MNPVELFNAVKSAFCELTSYKVRGEIVELITAFPTLTNKFVSVFIKIETEKIVVTDGGWIDSNYYDTPEYEIQANAANHIIDSYQHAYDIKTTIDKTGKKFYYKTCQHQTEIASIVFDLSNFIVGAVNAYCVRIKDEKEDLERDSFRKDADNFLKSNFKERVSFRGNLDDLKNIKFNAILEKSGQLFLITYITGSTSYYFENDLRKTIVNFEMTEKSIFKPHIRERISIINNESAGYAPERAANIIELLNEKTTRPAIKWSEKEALLEFLPN